MLLFAISLDLGYPLFTDSKKKFVSEFVRVLIKSDATGPTFTNPATVSLILCCLR